MLNSGVSEILLTSLNILDFSFWSLVSDKSAFWICCYWVFHLFLTGFPAVFNLESTEKTLLLFKESLFA